MKEHEVHRARKDAWRGVTFPGSRVKQVFIMFDHETRRREYAMREALKALTNLSIIGSITREQREDAIGLLKGAMNGVLFTDPTPGQIDADHRGAYGGIPPDDELDSEPDIGSTNGGGTEIAGGPQPSDPRPA